MSATADHAALQHGPAGRLGLKSGQVVQEIGYDSDVDEAMRAAVVAIAGELLHEEVDDVVDVVMLWWRDGDGDLVDALVDALTPLSAGGVIWVLTPKGGRPGHVEPSEVSESAPTAGLTQTSSISAGPDWSGARLVARGARR